MFIGRGYDNLQGNTHLNKVCMLYDWHNFSGYARSGMILENGVGTIGSL